MHHRAFAFFSNSVLLSGNAHCVVIFFLPILHLFPMKASAFKTKKANQATGYIYRTSQALQLCDSLFKKPHGRQTIAATATNSTPDVLEEAAHGWKKMLHHPHSVFKSTGASP
jgi:hypothetical protein